MHRKLTITLADEVYQGLHHKVGRGHISSFIEDLVRPHVVEPDPLDAAYREMSRDEEREAALERHEQLPEDWDRALAIVAHPDDLEYGAASAIARWTSQGKEVTYVLVTSGEAGIDTLAPEEAGPLRAEEERRSARVVGVSTVEFLKYPDGTVEYGLPLRRDLARMIRRFRPDVIISINPHLTWGHGAFNTADHRAVGLAILDAARDAGNRWIFRELLNEALEPWGGVRMVCFGASPQPTHAVDVTDFLAKGMESLREHAAYLTALGAADPAAFLRERASEVGKRLGCELAVDFEVFK
jgi:LmbE family N-acetylglucosaminyl deacetylase